LPGEETGSVALQSKLAPHGGWWTEDEDIGYHADGGDVYVCKLAWDDALTNEQNIAAASALLDKHLASRETLKVFRSGDGAHRGLSDWYPEKEAALKSALAAHLPFDTGWYGSKHEIASARIFSLDGVTVQVEASVSDDFDTNGSGSATAKDWTLESVADAVYKAWDDADKDRQDSEPYTGFSIHDSTGAWIETYLLSDGTFDTPPGDNYFWWGWQHDSIDDEVGLPDPRIPAHVVAAFEAWINESGVGEMTLDGWTIRRWRDE
jgi:hypothetical protein